MSDPIEIPDDGIIRTIPEHIAWAMMRVFLRWPLYELSISEWLMYVFSLDPQGGPILLGAMDSKTKIERIKSFSKIQGDEDISALFGTLSKTHPRAVQARNILAHNPYEGYLRDDPDTAVFRTFKSKPGEPDRIFHHCLHIDEMHSSAEFAETVGLNLTRQLRERQGLLAEQPPLGPLATPNPQDWVDPEN